MAIKVFADGANLEGMLDMYENGNVQGFTTNPSLMKKGGVTDYRAFAKEVLTHITDVSVSFEVFADDVETMEVEAREIATWAENVYVKIPCVTTKGESTAELVRKLSADGIKVNVTTIFTPTQVDEMVEAVDAETPSIISLFAGRIADTGVDPWNSRPQPQPKPQPQVAAEDDEYSMSDQSLGEATAMNLDDLKKLFEVKKVEQFAADDPKNPKNIQPAKKHSDE